MAHLALVCASRWEHLVYIYTGIRCSHKLLHREQYPPNLLYGGGGGEVPPHRFANLLRKNDVLLVEHVPHVRFTDVG